ncbi:MAG: hypothetical protein [Bacteriophage sp.]|nr:MAG: hypothetical protein [Bacteriophage sp.]
MMHNITKLDMANVGSGLGFKDAVEQDVEGVLEGFGIVDSERLNENTGELEKVVISFVKVNGQLFSGSSKVVEGRLKNLNAIVGDSNDVEGKKISVKFENIKLAKGNGTNLIVTRYDE